MLDKKKEQYIQWLWDVTEKPLKTKSYPPIVYIEPTNACNLKCKHCARYTMKRKASLLSVENFEKILYQIKDFVVTVYLFKQGEPLINKNIVYFIKRLRENNILVSLNTNATLLNEKKAEEIINSGINIIEFSIDSWKKDKYEQIRKGANFENVINNVIRFMKLKQIYGKDIITRIRMVEQDLNRDELLDTISLLKRLPFDDIRVNKLLNFFGKIEGEVQGKNTIENKKDVCSYLWKVISINSDGNVTCILDYDNIYSYGNVFKKPFKRIWNDLPMIKIREAFLSGKIEKLKDVAKDYCYICNARLKDDQKKPIDFVKAFCEYGYLYPDHYMPHLRIKRMEEEQKTIDNKYDQFDNVLNELEEYTGIKLNL